MNIVAMYIPGLDEASRVVRRTLMRYLNLSLVLVLRSISMAVKRRFPTKEHLVEAGFMTKTELEMFQSVPSTEFNTFWIPCTWFINVLREARQECRITDSNGLKLIMEELNEFRSKCGLLWGYDWISIPLVYTQVVTMATYAFFVLCIFGRQNVNSTDPHMRYHRYDYYVPIFTILQLMFYMGLLKVAEQLINPFGDDDEDFELNWIIDRHMKVSYLGVDTLNGTPPPLVKDTYYNELDVKIPYTEASRSYKKKTYRGSVAYMQVPMEQQGMVLPDMSEEEDDGETQSEHHMGPRRPSVYTLFGNKGSNHRGGSPSSSIINLDSESIDSEWKSSLPNITTASAKNASGTLGAHAKHPYVVEMCKAEDNEIVLDEVVIEPIDVKNELLSRSDSLKIPGTSGEPPGARPHTLASVLRQVSPKIAPKFTREKLKSMFRKGKRFAMDHPLFKMKGVTFSRDTKYDDDDDETDHPTLLLGVHDPQEVKITLSTPELTETEKLMGVHPYQFIQQRTPSPSGFADALLLQPSERSREHRLPLNEADIKIDPLEHVLVRSHSLPNISHCTAERIRLEDCIASQLKKKEVHKPGKGTKKEKKRPKRRKSPPPPPPGEFCLDLPSDTQSDQEFSDVSTSSPRRNTLPQIMVTRCDQKSPNHLDLAITPPSSVPSSGHSSDSGATLMRHPRRITADSPGLFVARDRSRSRSPQSRESLTSSECSSVTSKGTKPRAATGDRPPLYPKPKTLPQSEPKELSPSQTSKTPKTLEPPVKPLIRIPKTPDFPFSKEEPATAPAKPSTLTGPQIFTKSTQQKSGSLPGSPTSDIPCAFDISDSPSFPQSSQRTRESPRSSPTPSSSRASGTPDSAQGHTSQSTPSRFELTSVAVTDPHQCSTVTGENLRPSSMNPPVPPPRPTPRRGSRGRK